MSDCNNCYFNGHCEWYKPGTTCNDFKDAQHVVELPFIAGDMVYMPVLDEVLTMRVTAVNLYLGHTTFECTSLDVHSFDDTFTSVDIGKTVFRTEEEARKLLQKDEGTQDA